MYCIPYNGNLKEFARYLRRNSTPGEIRLWIHLKAKTLGYQFYRQRIIDNYIVDFYCPAFKLVVEIDGNYHDSMEQSIADDLRQKMLEERELNFLRFMELEATKEVERVVSEIKRFMEEH